MEEWEWNIISFSIKVQVQLLRYSYSPRFSAKPRDRDVLLIFNSRLESLESQIRTWMPYIAEYLVHLGTMICYRCWPLRINKSGQGQWQDRACAMCILHIIHISGTLIGGLSITKWKNNVIKHCQWQLMSWSHTTFFNILQPVLF